MTDNYKIKSITLLTSPSSSSSSSLCSLCNISYGYHDLVITIIDINTTNELTINGTINCLSIPSIYAYMVDIVYDELIWSYHHDGGDFNSELEYSLLQLLVEVNEDLIQTVSSWAPMMKMIGGDDDTTKMIDVLSSDIQKALETKSIFAIGRLHQSLMQFIENDDTGDGYGMSMSIMRLNNTTKETIKNYIVKKINASTISLQRIRSLIRELIQHMKHYLNG